VALALTTWPITALNGIADPYPDSYPDPYPGAFQCVLVRVGAGFLNTIASF
jgi:hypothetical protein